MQYIDLFNGYFKERFEVKEGRDYIAIDETLTLEKLLDFKKKPGRLCGNCDIEKRFTESFIPTESERAKSEWAEG